MTIEYRARQVFPGLYPIRKRTIYADGARWMLDKAAEWLADNAGKYKASGELLAAFKKAMEL